MDIFGNSVWDNTENENEKDENLTEEETAEELQPEEASDSDDAPEVSDEKDSEEETEETEEKPEEVAAKKPEKKFAHLKRYDELEEKVLDALEKEDIDTVLFLNELTLARNIEEHLSRNEMKQFRVIYVAFKTPDGVVKRAGIYNSIEIPNSEDAEDIMIAEDFTDYRVLCIPRNSIFAEHFAR